MSVCLVREKELSGTAGGVKNLARPETKLAAGLEETLSFFGTQQNALR